jgi:DNA polymerase III delta prime subunit
MARVLALSMRPSTLNELVDQDDIIKTIQSQFDSTRIPHFFIISGQIGVGKTTLARLLALIIQIGSTDLPENVKLSDYDIQEINAANKTGVDDMRQLVETMKYQPMSPSKAKVVILDESHQLTMAAQSALLKETEDAPKHSYYIFCTSHINKILAALQRRAYIITPKCLTEEGVKKLIERAKERVEFEESIDPLVECLNFHNINSAGLVLQAAERYFNGLPANESVLCTSENPSLDTMALCRHVSKGEWKQATLILKEVSKNDVVMVRSCLLGYLKTILLKSVGPKALVTAKAIQLIANSVTTEDSTSLTSFLSAVCLACDKFT